MNGFALLTLHRSLVRHRLYTALNVGGLSVGIAVFLVMGLYVRFETSYEQWLPHHDQIYLVRTGWHIPGAPVQGNQVKTMGGLLDQLKGDFPELQGTRIQPRKATVISNGVATAEVLAEVDPDFLDIFALPIASGQGNGALSDPSSLLIDEATARKYFPGLNPIGQPMTVSVQGVTTTYKVAAVFKDLPKATEIDRFDMLARLPSKAPDPEWNQWGLVSVLTYLRFAEPSDAKMFNDRMSAFVERHGRADMGPNVSKLISLSVLPVADLHLQTPSRKVTVTTLGVVGLLTLLIAIVNYVNLSTARASLRAGEVAMRKVLGASRMALMRQFLGEAVALTALGALVGLALAELGLPVVNAASGLSLTIPYIAVAPALVLLTLIVGVLAGLYPAALLSRIPAAPALASTHMSGGGRLSSRVREGLVVFQFGLAVAFIVGTLVLTAQTRHVRLADLGFDRNSLVVVPSLTNKSLSDGQRASIVAAFGTLPRVRTVAVSDTAAGDDGMYLAGNVKAPGQPGVGPILKKVMVGPGFFSTYGIRVIAGRVFDTTHGLDDSTGREDNDPHDVVIDRKAAAALGFRSPEDAIGKTVGESTPLTIVGVVESVRFYSPREPIPATYYEYMARGPSYAIASVKVAGDPRGAIEALRNAWRSVAPEVAFRADTAEQNLADYYESDDHAARLFTIASVLSVLIGCIGLWGLASFNTARRVKEIGLRKTLGASSADIVRLLVVQFLRPVLIANLIAWPLAWVAMSKWLAGFADRIALSPLYFIAATLLAVAIAALTVIGQSLAAARAGPAWALRHE